MLEGGVARAEKDELSAALQPAPDRGRRDVESLLLDETRDDREERHPRVLLSPASSWSASLFAARLSSVEASKLRDEVGVGGGIPGFRVDAVQDPREPVLPQAQDAVEPVAAFGGQDLARVGGRDGREHVGAEDPESHERIAESASGSARSASERRTL